MANTIFLGLAEFGQHLLQTVASTVNSFLTWQIDLGSTTIGFLDIFIGGFFIYAAVQLIIWGTDTVT